MRPYPSPVTGRPQLEQPAGPAVRLRPPAAGHCDARFAAVAREFERNFSDRGELGAACCAYVDGSRVVDLWGGVADRRRGTPWREDTVLLVFSTTKGLAATAVALARSRGLLDYDARVCDYWPEFAQAGKERITVRQLLAHQAGLPAVAERVDSGMLADLDRLAGVLARERPAWEPGRHHGYHALSIGWYEGELIRRIDPAHRTLGRFFDEEIARPLGLQFFIGQPERVAAGRRARLASFSSLQLLDPRTLPRRMLLALASPRSLTSRTFRNPPLRRPADLDRPEWHPVEIPAAGGVGEVRAVAKLYGDLARGAPTLRIDAATLAALAAPATPPSGGSFDLVLKLDSAYSLGYVRPRPALDFGVSPRAYGHPGAGGSFGFADPDAGVGFAYAPNRLGYHVANDPRERALREALYSALG